MNNTDYIIKKYSLEQVTGSPILIPDIKRDELIKLFSELGYKVGAEVGVERGLYSEQLCLGIPGLKMYCVDSWKVSPDCPEYPKQRYLDKYYDQAKSRLSQYNCELIRKSSLDASRDFAPNSLDFVYLDANHAFDSIMNDITWWFPIVKPGGIVSGHDYTRRNMSHTINYGVIEATNIFTTDHNISPWFVFSGERSASWFWVKK